MLKIRREKEFELDDIYEVNLKAFESSPEANLKNISGLVNAQIKTLVWVTGINS